MSQFPPLEGCKICVIGVTIPEEERRIIRIIDELGGEYTSRVKDDTFCVLVKKVGPQHNAIQTFKIPTVDLQWLWDCRSYRRKLLFDQYHSKPFIGLCISCTGYTNDERNLIEKCVIENGGEFSSKMSRETCTHLITEDEDPSPTSKFAYAKIWRSVQIVTMRWLTDCKKQKSWISEYDYLVSTAAADALAAEEKRIKELKKSQVEKQNRLNDALKSNKNPKFLSITAIEKIEKNDNENNTEKSVNTKKRKLNDALFIPTLQDLPSYELLDHKKCMNLLNFETFFIAGFTHEIRDYLLRLILFAGGRRHHVLTSSVTKIMLGVHADDRIVAAARVHPLGAQCVTISWLVQTLFSTI